MNTLRSGIVIVLLLVCFHVHADFDANHDQSAELITLDKLIQSTQRLLENQQILRLSIKQFQDLQSLYLKDTENKELLLKVAKSALQVSDKIKETHLEYAFSSDFLSEVSLFAKFATKRSVPSPDIK